MLDRSNKPPPKRVRRPTRGMDIDQSCEVTRESNMICPITCRCHNSLLDNREKTRVVSQILQSTRKIWKNELIAICGLTAAITNKEEISELKQAQKERNSDLYCTSIQYTVLGNIHSKEVYLVPPQDLALLLEDRISPKLRKHLKQHNATEGVGQLANHTCCDIHWNANLEVTAIDHYEKTAIQPMGILRARKDIEKDTEILTRYWHKNKDAWQNIFECECCACTNHTGNMPDPLATADTAAVEDTVSTTGHSPRKRQDLETRNHEPNQDNFARNKQEYPESEIDDWDWDELEASPFKGTTNPTQPLTKSPPLMVNKGATRGPGHKDYPDHEADTLSTMSQLPLNSMLENIASVPSQSFPETWQPTVGAQVTVYTGGDAQKWKVNHIRQGIGTSITIKHKDSEMIVDKSWFMFDINMGSLVLQRLGFFSNIALKRTTNSIEIWRNILNPDKMMDGETLTVLLEWTIHGNPSNDELGLPGAQSKTWLVDRSFWQSWEQKQ